MVLLLLSIYHQSIMLVIIDYDRQNPSINNTMLFITIIKQNWIENFQLNSINLPRNQAIKKIGEEKQRSGI